MTDKTSPSTQLQLDWVYGYRGHQCRNNLFYTSTREVVYFVAGVGVVFNPKYHAQKFFLGHNDDIISLALHPEGKLVATGQVGKEPYICVWDSTSCQTVSILKDNHQRGVACVAFGSSGLQLASVGLEDYSQVTIWDWKKGKALASTRGHSDRIFDVCFNPFEDNKLVTCGVKHIKFWSLCGNSLTGKKGIFGKKGEIQSVLCLAYGTGGVLYTGTLSGDIYKWQENTLVENIAGAHAGGVFTLNATPDGYASGSKDGTVALWDTEFKPITRIDLNRHSIGYSGISVRSVCWGGERILVGTNAGEVFEVCAADKDKPITIVQGHAEGELWGLAMHPKKTVFATGSDDLTVRLLDMASKSLLAKTGFDQTIRSLAYSPDGAHLAVGHGDGSFRILKGRDLSELVHIHDHKEVIHEMKYSPDGTLFAVGSNDNLVDIYSIQDRYKRVGQCKGNSSYITHIDWSEDSCYIQTNSGAAERLFYKMPVGKRITRKEEIESIHWQTWTSVLGPEVNGIWEKYTDTTDVNASDTNFQQGVIATGDDFGLVKLFRFPCVKKGAKFRKYVGHSAHVTNVRFSTDGMSLVSTGGADHAVFQWKVIPEGYSDDASDTGSVVGAMQNESNDEASDSDLSDVDPLDSDVEEEVNKDYSRDIYKEDMPKIQRKLKSMDGSSATKKARPNAPSKGVKLNFVFGYRGYDCRNNLFYTQSGEIVYHVAAVGIVYKKETHSQRFYLGHDDDILCLTLHPIKDLVASGQVGRDAAIHIWDAEKLEAVSILKGQHERGVCALDFSADGKKLGSVGLDENHCIVIWDWRRGEKLATTRAHKDKIFELRWDSNHVDKLVTVGVRHLKFWTQAGGGLTGKRGTFGDKAKADTMLCITYPKTPGVCVSGGSTGFVYIWNNENLKGTVQAHQGPVFAIHALEKGYVSGGKDGTVCLWDESMSRCLKSYKLNKASLAPGQTKEVLVHDLPPIRAVTLGQGKILVGTKNGEICEIDKSGPITSLVQGHCEGEIWGLCHHPSALISATVSDDKTLRVWDLQKYLLIKSRKFAKPGRCVAFSTDGKAIAVGFNDGSFVVVNFNTLEDIISFHHRKEEISDLKFSPGEGKYLAVASHDNFVDIYNVLSNNRVGICKGASSYITHLDWDVRGKLLQINSGAKEHLYFEAPRGSRQAIVSSELKKIKWSTWTGVLGKDCEGIWAPGSDITDINASDLTKDGSLLATGDDFGFVKLFDFPSSGKNAKCKKYNGHSAHVTNVRWAHNDSLLLSTGGADTSVMVWLSLDFNENGPDTAPEDKGVESDTDSEEESGYDSDVEREKNIDYTSKIYTNPLREAKGTKPQSQELSQEDKKRVSRGTSAKSKVQQETHEGKRRKQEVNDLTLEFIHGYRGFDARNNLHYSSEGSLVFHAAGAGIVYNLETKTQTFYLEHTDDIICLAMNQNPKFKNIVATGQIGTNPMVHVWNVSTKQTLSIVQGFHEKGVCSVKFSSSGRYLVTVGLDDGHSLAVWKWSDGTKVASSLGHTRRIFVAEFRPDSDTAFVTCGVKHVMWWTVTGGVLVGKKGNLSSYEDDASMQTMLSVAFGPNDTTFTGAMNGDVYFWSGSSLTRIVKHVHNGPVFSMFTTVKDGLIVTGGKDKGTEKDSAPVKLWDQEMKRCKAFQVGKGAVVRSVFRGTNKGTILVGTQDNEIFEINEKTAAHQAIIEGHSDGEMWGLSTHPVKDVFATSSDDGTIRTWDIQNQSLLNKVDIGGAVRCCCFSPDGDYLGIGLKTGEFHIVDGNTLKSLTKKRDRNQSVTEMRFSPDGKLLAVGTEDRSVDFYSFKPHIKRIGYCKNIASSVNQLDFAADGKHIQVCTGSYERLIFSVPDGTHVTDEAKISRLTWSSWTCTLGSDVIGIWPKNADKGDINCTHLTHTAKTLATGDDFGYVKLYKFPVTERYTKGKKYVGHSAHVTNVQFTHDDRYLISTGGDDCCVFVWKCS